MEDKNRYKIFDEVLQDINKKFINPTSEVGQDYRESFQDFFNSFRKVIYDIDPVANSYRKIQYVGSNYDDLMVGTTYNEFDMNLLIPMDSKNVEVYNSCPGFVDIKFNIPSNTDPKKSEIFKSWLNADGYLMPSEFKKWGESVISKSLNTLESNTLKGERGDYRLKTRKAGPAFTMCVEKIDSDIRFDVDFVFCLEFDHLPNCFKTIPGVTIKEWMAVPKLPKDQTDQKAYRRWRYSFPKIEKQELANNYHLKSAVRLIKKLRDNNQLTFLPSYYIKTVFLWEVQEHPPKFWRESLGYLFMTMLNKLKMAVDEKKLPFRFDETMNLFDTLKGNQLNECSKRLKGLIDKLDSYADNKTPDKIKMILLNEEERKMYPEIKEINCELGSNYDTQNSTASDGPSYVDNNESVEDNASNRTNQTDDRLIRILMQTSATLAMLSSILLYRTLAKDRNADK